MTVYSPSGLSLKPSACVGNGGRALFCGWFGLFCCSALLPSPFSIQCNSDSQGLFDLQIQGNITPHAIVILPKTDGMEMLVCYEDEGVYVNTYGRITKDVVLQWGEMPTSVGRSALPLHLLKIQATSKMRSWECWAGVIWDEGHFPLLSKGISLSQLWDAIAQFLQFGSP